MKIYLVRHGQVNHNLYKKYSTEDEDLNETGVKQAIILREKIKEIIFDYRIKERNPGSLKGQSISVTNSEEYWFYYSNVQYGTSENIQDFLKKFTVS